MWNRRSLGLALSALSFGVLVWFVARRPLQHDDLFFHLHTGELIARSGRVPCSDPFSFTLPGAAWTTHEWGFALAMYGVYALAGYPGLVIALQVITLAIFALIALGMLAAVRAERRALIVPLLLVGLFAGERACVVLRAAIVSTLALAALCVLLQRPQRTRERAMIAALFLVWANVHAGVLFGLIVVGAHALRPMFDGASRIRESSWCALYAAITLVNPNGVDLWTFPYRLDRVLYHSGLHYQMGIFDRPTMQHYPLCFMLMALCLAACLPLARLRRALASRTLPVLGQFVALLFFAVMTLRSNRFMLDFVVLALLFCASLWGGRLEAASDEPARVPGHMGALAHVLACAISVTLLLPFPRAPRRTLDARFSPRAFDFIARHALAGRMFNPEAWGGYLGWRLHVPVFWDGRNDVFGPIAREVARSDAASLVQHHQLDWLLLDAVYHPKFLGFLNAHRERWALVYFDDYLAVYVARTPQRCALLDRFEYRELRPFDVPSEERLRELAQPARRARVGAELAQLLAQNPETSFAWYVRGLLAEQRGDAHDAYLALQRTAAILPRAQTFYHWARAANDLGRPDEARALLQRSLALSKQ
jgi:hypothetical protein